MRETHFQAQVYGPGPVMPKTMAFLLGMDFEWVLTNPPRLWGIAKRTPSLLALPQNWRQNSPTQSSASGHLAAFAPS